MELRPVDPRDDVHVRALHGAFHQAAVHDVRHPTSWALEELRADLQAAPVGSRQQAFAAYVDGCVVSAGILRLPLMDNLGTAQVQVATPPGSRRRGHGAAVLEHLLGLAAAEGRDVLQAEVEWDHQDAPDGSDSPGGRFAVRHGFQLSLVDVKRGLSLPVAQSDLDRLGQQAAGRHVGYGLRDWVGPVPDDVLGDFGVLLGSLATEAPMGDLEIEDEVFDAARIRAAERTLAASGRRKHTTVALAPDGTLAGYTELVVPDHDPGRVYQWGTLVRPAHRGHRLGMALKVRNLSRLQAAEPGRELVVTWNAEVNAQMVAVNEALGFRPIGRLGEFQRRL